MNRIRLLEEKGILILKDRDEKKEIEFELNYLSSLSVSQRFLLMQTKSHELKSNLVKNGYRKTPQIIKRK
jgi:hypothetical protein